MALQKHFFAKSMRMTQVEVVKEYKDMEGDPHVKGQRRALAQQLADDPKENAEHVMLVDLARNDLARHGDAVEVKTFREIQFYSHVIHLVSEVTARLADGANSLQVVADTFPAGTLSGAPKHRAMQLIDGHALNARQVHMCRPTRSNQLSIFETLTSRPNTLEIRRQ